MMDGIRRNQKKRNQPIFFSKTSVPVVKNVKANVSNPYAACVFLPTLLLQVE